MKIVLQPDARDDLREIWRYGTSKWSIVLSDAYLDVLLTAIERLVYNPASGAPICPDPAAYRRLVVASHSIFYRLENDAILIVRILHSRSDTERRLDPPQMRD